MRLVERELPDRYRLAYTAASRFKALHCPDCPYKTRAASKYVNHRFERHGRYLEPMETDWKDRLDSRPK
jgi:hypothetical protein